METATRTHKRILVVEDEEALSRLMKWQLESSGFEGRTETHGGEALNYAAEHRPDLVILDLRLPDIHGYEVCRQLYNPWVVPVLMLTALDRPIDQLRGFAYGADAYLTKPYEETELLKTVNILLAGGATV